MSTIVARFVKDIDAELDYVMDWSDWFYDFLDATIAESIWEVIAVEAPDGTALEDVDPIEILHKATGTKATAVWTKKGTGTKGAVYHLENTITSNSVPPRTDQRSLRIVVQD